MTTPLDTRNALAMEMLVASDQSYVNGTSERVTKGTRIGPLSDSSGASEAPLPYALPDPGFVVAQVIEEPTTGFKSVLYKHETRNEFIVAMAGTDGPNYQDWAQNLRWGWGQWDFIDPATKRLSEKSGRFKVAAALEDLVNPDSKPVIHFTGQSLGGALAEYAAFDYWRANQIKYPDILNRLTLTTFNGLAGGAALTRLGGVADEQLAAFRPARTAHYEVSNDLINRFGGHHLAAAGNLYRLDFRSEKTNPATGEKWLLNPVDAHRIESGFYRPFAQQIAKGDSRLFNQATANTDWQPFPVEGLQAEPGRLVSLFNRGNVSETSGKHRAIAGVIVALNQATRAGDVDALFKPVVEAIVRSDLDAADDGIVTQAWKAVLPRLIHHVSSDDLRGIAQEAKAHALRRLLTALVIEALAQGDQRPHVDRINALLEGTPIDPEVQAFIQQPIDADTRLQQLATGVGLIDLDASGLREVDLAILDEFAIDPVVIQKGLFEHAAVSDNWLLPFVTTLVKAADIAAAEKIIDTHVATAKILLNSLVATSEWLVEQQSQAWRPLVDAATTVARVINDALPDYLPEGGDDFEFPEIRAFGEQRTVVSRFSEYLGRLADAVASALADTDAAAALPKELRDAQRLLQDAAQTVVISQENVDPFARGAAPDPNAVASAGTREGQARGFTLYLPYPTGDQGQKIKLTLSGANVAAFTVLADGKTIELGADGAFELTVAAGERQTAFALWSADDVDSDQALSLKAQLVDAEGTPTHSEHAELTLALDAEDEPAPKEMPPASRTLVGDLEAIDFDPKTAGVQARNDDLGNVLTDPARPEPGRSDTLYDSLGADFITTAAGNDLVIRQRGGDDVVDLGEGDDTLSTLTDLSGRVQAKGGSGRDYLGSGAGNDSLQGGEGGDALYGAGGDDTLYGDALGEAAEFMRAGASQPGSGESGELVDSEGGDDQVFTGAGNDAIATGSEEDLIVSGGGDDWIWSDGNLWADGPWSEWAIREKAEATGSGTAYSYEINAIGSELAAASGSDRIYAGAGDDVVFAAGDDDFLMLEDGNDRAWGGAGKDALLGGGGRDFLVGDDQNAADDDFLDGGDGDDVLLAGEGKDVLLGGAGDDHLWGDGDAGFVLHEWTVARKVETQDKVRRYEAVFANAHYGVSDTGANDVLLGGSGADWLFGNAGDDLLDGGAGDDVGFGESGNDELAGGEGNDVLSGDVPADKEGQHGNDQLDGGAGNDTLQGSGGKDTLLGGEGNDQLSGDRRPDPRPPARRRPARWRSRQRYALGQWGRRLAPRRRRRRRAVRRFLGNAGRVSARRLPRRRRWRRQDVG